MRRIVASAMGPALFVASAFVVSLAPAQPVDAAFACAASGPAYTVRSGDGWYGIADEADVSVGSLLSANGAELDDVLLPGDRLCLPSGANPAAGCDTTYTVRSGDSWYGIADRSGVSPTSLLRANRAELETVLFPDQTICLPSGARVPTSRTSPSSTPHAATVNSTATSTGRGEVAASAATYRVRSGDGWFIIADRFQVGPAALLAANDAELTDVLVPGQELILPAGAATEVPTATSTTSTYTVRSGDGWFIIADRVQVRAAALLAANDAELTDVLVPGQELILPAGAVVPPERDPDEPVWVTLDAAPTQGPCWYHDTWHDSRSEGRVHVGVDIFTVPGEYVYAVADGRLTGRSWDQPDRRSGNAWYLTADSGHRFFYAHMAGFAPDLEVGSRVQAGQIIGWVGQTGNATYPHLHFEIHPWGGEPVNPYPMVRTQGACNRDAPYTQPGGWVPD